MLKIRAKSIFSALNLAFSSKAASAAAFSILGSRLKPIFIWVFTSFILSTALQGVNILLTENRIMVSYKFTKKVPRHKAASESKFPLAISAPSSSLVRTNGSQPLNTGSNPVGAIDYTSFILIYA